MSTSFVGGKRNDDGLGCGCWSPAAGSHHTDYLLRNTLLVLMSLIGIAGGSISIGASLFGASAGLLVAVLIMELPLIRSVVRDINTGGQIA
jgi:hypothetical protein